MLQDEFIEAVERYGADIANWPQSLQEPARALALRDSACQNALATAQQLQGLLRSLPDTPVPAELWGKLFAVPERAAQVSLAVLWSMLGRFGRVGSAAAFAGALLAGVMLAGMDVSVFDASGAESLETLSTAAVWGLL
ncbi:MAG: hypothetical protein KBA75_03655 [Alphaproteobacteria bacterium]|nr:hypothetical protein [Alphaproteobacteria bacterium]